MDIGSGGGEARGGVDIESGGDDVRVQVDKQVEQCIYSKV